MRRSKLVKGFENPKVGTGRIWERIQRFGEPAIRRMHVTLGNPCNSRYVTCSMDA
jgi:hypothetical protein